MEPLMKKMAVKMTRYVHFSGSRKRSPLPGTPKMSWETTATYGAKGPFMFGRGTEHVAQRAEERSVVRQRSHGQFYPGSGYREA
jgi:hypothetical protein